MAFYDPTIFDVHVLLVDHDMNALFETTRLLQFNSYKVTPVDDASLASSILLSSQGNGSFNLVMVDVNTSNLQGFKLLHEAISMGLPVILMASIASPTLAKCAIEDGAFLFMQKPTSPDELKYIWQHILRETTRKNKEKGSHGETLTTNNHNNQYCHYMYGGDNFEKTAESVAMNQKISTTNRQKGRLGEILSFGSDSCDNNNNNNNNGPFGDCMGMRPKICTEWTPDLHEKFMDAVKQLGDGRCFPKDILELMNVPGLKRMQVASHLQKCRHGWQPSNGKQGRRPNSSKPPICKPYTKRYGIFPRGSQPQLFPKDAPDTETSNIEKSATWDSSTPASNNNLNENALNMFGIQPLDFGANDFNVNESDYEHSVTGQTSHLDPAIADANFWTSWIRDFAREI